jgi:hypothetical protein
MRAVSAATLALVAVVFPMLSPSAQTGSASRETFDLATFETPPGWQNLPLPDRLVLRTQAGDGQIVLLPSFASAASPTQNFEAEWAKLVTAMLGPGSVPQVSSEQTPDGWTGVIGITSVTRENQTATVLLVTTTGFGRAMSIVAILSSQERVPEVTRFFERIDFRAPAATPAAPAAPTSSRAPPAPPVPAESTEVVAVAPGAFVDGAPQGLFYRVTAGFTTYGRVTAETRLFLPGNRIVRASPYGGDTFAMSRCLPDQCGTYRIDPGYLTITWGNRQVDRWTLTRASDGMDLDGATFRPARPVPASALVGRWSAASSDGNPYANVYTFERDGTFTFGTTSSTRLTGRFAVQGMTLVLRFSDGSEERRTLFVTSTDQRIGSIAINGEVFIG